MMAVGLVDAGLGLVFVDVQARRGLLARSGPPYDLMMAARRMHPDMPAEQLDRIWRHPLQTRGLNVIAELLGDLRACDDHADYNDFQRDLGREIYEHELEQAAVARAVKRLSKGDKLQAAAPELQNGGDPTDLEAWLDEQATYERVVRQLRSVGDALAWRATDYNRRYIMAMSRNAPAGPMALKAGLDSELGRVDYEWRQNGRFTLLHDITTCVRVGDITVFTDAGPSIGEVKAKRRVPAAQAARMRQAVAAAAGGVLPGTEDGRIVEVPVDARTNMSALADALTLAERRGVIGFAVRGGRRGVVAASLLTLAGHHDQQAMVARWDAAADNSMRKAGFTRPERHIEVRSTDSAGRHPGLAPFGIYPLPARQCAELICDALIFEVRMPIAALIAFAADEGLSAQSVLPSDPATVDSDTPALQVWNDHNTVTLTFDAVQQQLLQFTDIRAFMAGLRCLLELPNCPRQPYPIFRNDRRLWR
jgi:hypothetical protein